jgi:hypothetical protein
VYQSVVAARFLVSKQPDGTWSAVKIDDGAPSGQPVSVADWDDIDRLAVKWKRDDVWDSAAFEEFCALFGLDVSVAI